MRRLVGLSLLLVGLLPVAASAENGAERHPAIFPPQKIPLSFSHSEHLEAGAECVTCHDEVRKSQKASDWNLPKHPECETCHDIELARRGKKVDPPSDCLTCHPGYQPTVMRVPAKVELPTANLNFPHKVHVDRKVDCSVCHGDMTKVDLATRMQLPKMATCLECHDGHQASNACATCHLKQPGGRLRLSFTSGMLRPFQGDPLGMDHGPRFEFTHGPRATVARSTCMECHAERECQACHDALQKPLSVHPNDFITLHPVQARAHLTECTSCHRLQSFCASCHARAGVSMDVDPSLLPRNLKVHSDYFTFVEDTLSPQHHGIQASRDIQQCVACHREESCMTCHSEFATRQAPVNPHPAGFQQMCGSLRGRNERPCLKCHTEASLDARGCR